MVQSDSDRIKRDFADRLNQALDELGIPRHGRGKWLADKMGVSAKGAGKWLNGDALPESWRIQSLAEIVRKEPEWLQYGKEPSKFLVTQTAYPALAWDEENPLPEDQFVLAKRLNLQLSAGNGTVVYEIEEKRPLAIRSDWLLSMGSKPGNVVFTEVKGDSMEPTLTEGETLLIDISKNDIVDGRVYAIRYGDEVRVKRLFKRFDGSILIKSDNPSYPEEVVRPEEMDFISVIGRVIWRGGSGNL